MSDPINTLEQLLAGLKAAAAVKPTALLVPELGGTIYVRAMTGAEWLDIDSDQPPATATKAQRIGWNLSRGLCNSEGVRLIEPTNLLALDLLAQLPQPVCQRILDAMKVIDGADAKNA